MSGNVVPWLDQREGSVCFALCTSPCVPLIMMCCMFTSRLRLISTENGYKELIGDVNEIMTDRSK